jgi:hypothetical protein
MSHPETGVWTAHPPGRPEADRRSAWGTELALATLVMVLLAAFGVLLGVLWQWVTPGAVVVMTTDGPVHADPTSEGYFADDGWFALFGGAAGVLVGLACWILVPRHRGPLVMIGMVAGCLLGAVVAWQVGRHIGLAAFRNLLEHAPVGRTFHRPARLAALGVLGVQGFAAVFTYTLLAGWSQADTLWQTPARDSSAGPGPDDHRPDGWAAQIRTVGPA